MRRWWWAPLASPRCSTEPCELFIEPLLHQVGYPPVRCAEPGGVPPTVSSGALLLYLGWVGGQSRGRGEGSGAWREGSEGEGRGASGGVARGEWREARRGWSVVG